jgi:coiled-coil domain-containing protein 115
MEAGTVCAVGETGRGVRVGNVPEKEEDSTESVDEEGKEDGPGKQRHSKSLRMFGAFVPPELKAAQGDAIVLVEDIIPRLILVDLEMKELEIKIRRTRKHRAKEEGKNERARELVSAH